MSLILALSMLMQSPPPEIHAVHFVPGDIPSVIITGRNLWVGTEGLSVGPDGKKNTVKINSVLGEWDAINGASGNDANRGLYCVQRVWFPRGLEPSPSAKVEFTRYDNMATSAMVLIPINRGRRERIDAGSTQAISTPIVVGDGKTCDLAGQTIQPSTSFSGSELIRYGRGASITNGRLFIPSDCKAPIKAAMRPADADIQRPFIAPSYGLHATAIEIIDNRPRGVGIYVAGSRNILMAHCKIIANSAIERGQYDESAENIFWECEFSSPRGRFDGGVGNVLCGDRNLVWRCRWHDIDRGPTGGCWGSPQERTTWFECEQANTGWTQGASEGLLYESYECVQATARFNGTEAVIEGAASAPRLNWNQIKEGYFVARPDGRWARIRTNLRYQGETSFRLLLDRSISTNQPGDSIGDVRIGNGIIQNNFIRCRFTHGKSGIFFFGMALDNYIGGCAFHDLRGGVVQLQRRSRDGWSFGVNTSDRVNFFRGVDQPWVTIPDSINWPPRG